MRIVIDPAHGGADPGSKAAGAVEKDWNLRFGKALARAAQEAGLEPVLVRERDETLDWKDRLDRIHQAIAPLVLVVHADRELTGTRRGPLFVIQPPTGPVDPPGLLPWGWVPASRHRASLKLARFMARALGSNPGMQALSDRSGSPGEALTWEGSILCASHVHLRYLNAPAVVLTPLFITSKADLEAFSSDAAVEAFATRVIAGVKEYLHTGMEENP